MYGKGWLSLELPAQANVQVIEPREVEALADEQAAFLEAVRAPRGASALAGLVKPGETLAIVTADGTRPVPSRKLIPWILDELQVTPRETIVITGTGSHRPNTPEELLAIFGPRHERVPRHQSRYLRRQPPSLSRHNASRLPDALLPRVRRG
jgi:nickel-dependent lactate racemase